MRDSPTHVGGVLRQWLGHPSFTWNVGPFRGIDPYAGRWHKAEARVVAGMPENYHYGFVQVVSMSQRLLREGRTDSGPLVGF